MRLRPSGRAGPLANSLEGFETYHAQSAWTWEHHGADPRARDPRARRAGRAARARSSSARSAGRAIRTPCCATSPTCATASPSTRRPRARGTSSTCRGGLFDIDFVAQYLALRHAADASGDPRSASRRDAAPGRRRSACSTPPTPSGCAPRALLLSDVQSLLRLTLDGDEASFDESQGAGGPAPADRRRPRTCPTSRRCAHADRG